MYHKKIISLKIFAKNVNAPRARAGVTKPFSQYVKNGARYLNKFFFPEKYSLSATCWVTFEFLSNNSSL